MNPARLAATDAVNQQLAKTSSMAPISIPVGGMDHRDHRLAQAIYRESVRRWLTLEALLASRLRQPLHAIEPQLRAVLMTGCAQMVFMDKLPVHAVVDDSVSIAKQRIRSGAGGLVNAVLRKIAGLVRERHPTGGWTPARDRIPWRDGFIELNDQVLPPTEPLNTHLAAATSHPVALVDYWLDSYGPDTTLQLLQHSHQTAPLIVHVGNASDEGQEEFERHQSERYAVWTGGPDRLGGFLQADPVTRWGQDPTAGEAAAATVDRSPTYIIDACAGRGTKTRQLAYLHPGAKIVATDTDAARFADLTAAFSGWPNVEVTPHAEMNKHTGRADLIVLDVPCSNLGVLARRLEARYRYSRASIESLINLQRQIVDHAIAWLRRDDAGELDGTLLYSTCSIDRRENEDQADWIAQRLELRVARSQATLPGGADSGYHDGGYFAVLEP